MDTGQPKEPRYGREERYIFVQQPGLQRLKQQRAYEKGRAQGACDTCLAVVYTYICCGLLSVVGRASG